MQGDIHQNTKKVDFRGMAHRKLSIKSIERNLPYLLQNNQQLPETNIQTNKQTKGKQLAKSFIVYSSE